MIIELNVLGVNYLRKLQIFLLVLRAASNQSANYVGVFQGGVPKFGQKGLSAKQSYSGSNPLVASTWAGSLYGKMQLLQG